MNDDAISETGHVHIIVSLTQEMRRDAHK